MARRDGPARLDPEREARALAALRAVPYRSLPPPPRSIGKLAMKTFRAQLAAAGPSLSRLEANWPEIVGERLAAMTRPGKLTSGKRGRELVIHALPAAAAIALHMTEQIRQRVSMSAGGDIVAVRIVQGPLPAPRDAAPPRAPRRALTPQERAELEAGAAAIEDPRLRAALVALGEAMLTRP